MQIESKKSGFGDMLNPSFFVLKISVVATFSIIPARFKWQILVQRVGILVRRARFDYIESHCHIFKFKITALSVT